MWRFFQVSARFQKLLVSCMLLETFIKYSFLCFCFVLLVSKLYFCKSCSNSYPPLGRRYLYWVSTKQEEQFPVLRGLGQIGDPLGAPYPLSSNGKWGR